jgi:membrane-associated phospholipid phosphatase
MSARAGAGETSNYFAGLFALARLSVTQLLRPPSHSRRAEAARRLARHAWLATAISGAAIAALMYWLDAREIALMPPRGTLSLWPVRILTDFGKDSYVVTCLAAALLVVGLGAAALRGTARARLIGFGLRLEFLLLAVATPLAAGEIIKWVVGRGRPFTGGKANPFNFAPFAGTEAYASLPSAHAITAAALALAVASVWPQARLPMILYALLIAGSRLVLLAHHPSDVVAGALIGVVGAMLVRYWFAARRLGFAILRDGKIVPLRTASGDLKRVAREAPAP